ncbi:MAG: bifunctional nuclease family protein [Actinomycetales bacterium]|nr:bifunctional nuclease family protein [Actinomycetales bacterium]
MRDDLVEMQVLGVRRQVPLDQVVVLLLDAEGGRVLPIVVGLTEGQAIAAGQAGVVPPRPMTHDLLATVLRTLGAVLERVEIVALIDGVFHAALVLGDGRRIDSRASDAIALAVRSGSPVLCDRDVLDESGLEVQETASEEEEVEEFRAFLDTVSADDFVAKDEGEQGSGP